MRLHDINKVLYRKRLNRIIVACIIALAAGSLAISQLLILLFPDESGSHFHWNFIGVLVTAISIGLLLNKYRYSEFMTEVVYVWELKKALNKINRKMPQIKLAAQQGNVDALITLQYCYAGSRQLWQLDDNTITMEELAIHQAELDGLATQYNLRLNANDYNEGMLKKF
ncbi:DUF3087 domain-containing protein [Aliiglaciecola sp. 3_MG-2023]|uniref:DUF3087 domain-containing protein n=1 Tax=Aliiglaciecola sp. 3_MG-2023 TaxID=3062644 RepID=UPI0026E16C56|nr:DUF3087 domain-containing protein [Aliiglaciecola sp. 3_MG-2023]MDO6691700.1 DUF3087 domain-containing protein [Aliiglaciecola sp. 3_MG-2023]